MAAEWAWTTNQEGPVVPLGERIKDLRKEHGWSQAELAQKVGAESQRISRYETGKLTPSIPALVRLAEALDTSIDYLVIDDAPRRPLQGADLHLAERIIELGQLDDTDRQAVLHIIEGLIAKNRVKAAFSQAS